MLNVVSNNSISTTYQPNMVMVSKVRREGAFWCHCNSSRSRSSKHSCKRLKDGGRLLIPVGDDEQQLLKIVRHGDEFLSSVIEVVSLYLLFLVSGNNKTNGVQSG